MNQEQNLNRGNFVKPPSIKNKKVKGYDLLNPCYSDSQHVNGLPINKNNSAIVICSNENEENDEVGQLKTCRNNLKNELPQKRDNTPQRNVLKLLHSNSSCRSVSNGKKTKSKNPQKGRMVSK